MKKAKKKVKGEECKVCCCGNHGSGGAVYGLGFIGAAVYFISTATSFWTGLLGILKAAVWPAFVVHGLLSLLSMVS
jgi:hypothetical protein